MDSESYGYLALFALIISAVLLFAGCLKARKGPVFLAPKLMVGGSSLLLIGLIFILIVVMADTGFELAIMAGILFILGLFLFFIGFIAFCARWGATGKRRTELMELTAALSSMHGVKQGAPILNKAPNQKPPLSS